MLATILGSEVLRGALGKDSAICAESSSACKGDQNFFWPKRSPADEELSKLIPAPPLVAQAALLQHQSKGIGSRARKRHGTVCPHGAVLLPVASGTADP